MGALRFLRCVHALCATLANIKEWCQTLETENIRARCLVEGPQTVGFVAPERVRSTPAKLPPVESRIRWEDRALLREDVNAEWT